MLPDNHFFFFDFTLDHTQIKTGTAFAPVIDECENPVILDKTNLCPYPIPKLDDIVKDIEKAAYQVDKHKFVSDLFECGALAISNQVDFAQREKREERYLQIIKSYMPHQQKSLAEIFGKIYALLTSVVYDNGTFNDWLGELFMKCNLGNKYAGQFFTPYHVSEFMAKAAMDETILKEKAAEDEIITISDPTCGGGGMLMAALDVLRNCGVNYARNCFMQVDDIDERCVHMTYLQLFLAGVPTIVRHQNSLTRELWGVWYTPALLFQYPRFRQRLNLN